jgi:hypothetical protein
LLDAETEEALQQYLQTGEGYWPISRLRSQ